MTPLIIQLCMIFFTLINCVSSAVYGDANSTFTEFRRREIRSPAFIENSQDFQGSVIFNTYFSSCASSCSENDAECLERCTSQKSVVKKLGTDEKTPRIVGGKEVKRIENTGMASLNFQELHTCGASIINKYHVLTAAHCVGTTRNKYEILSYTILTGLLDQGTYKDRINKKINKYNISKIMTHERYKTGELPYDIAVLRTSTPIVFSADVKPAYLAPPGLDSCDFATAWGWGLTSSTSRASPVLRKVDLPKLPMEKCFLKTRDEADRLCYGHENAIKNVCNGDSGGPLTCKKNGYQIGLMSYNFNYCTKGPGVFTRVAAYQDWVAKQVFSP